MNATELTELEMRLRSWAPRRPSKTLRQRLFPRSALARQAVPVTPLASRFALSWLTASAAAALLLTVLRLPQPALSPAGAAHPFVAVALSNQEAVASLYAASSNAQFSAPSLALTNLRPMTSSVSPRSLTTRTN